MSAPFASSAPWLRGLALKTGSLYLALHVFTRRCTHACTHTHTHTYTHTPGSSHTGRGLVCIPQAGGITGRTEWQVGGARLGFSRFGPLPFSLMEEGMATHPSTLAWRIQWTEESSGYSPLGLQRVKHD